MHSLITVEELDAIKMCKPYLDGEKAIVEASGGKSLSQEEFVQARDLLLFKFTVATGTRPGPLNNALLEDYDTAREQRTKDGPAISWNG